MKKINWNISIHAPRVGGDRYGHGDLIGIAISIHAPRVGGDPPRAILFHLTFHISIHAPRVGGDRSGDYHGG